MIQNLQVVTMGTKAKDVIVNNDMLKEYEEKLDQATTDEKKNNLSKCI